MHDLELNGGLEWPATGQILVFLGWPRADAYAEALVGSYADAEGWLRRAVRERHGDSLKPSPARKAGEKPIVQRLFDANIPASITWMYDSAFAVTRHGRQLKCARIWTGAEKRLAEDFFFQG